jgi:hypothetical protein
MVRISLKDLSLICYICYISYTSHLIAQPHLDQPHRHHSSPSRHPPITVHHNDSSPGHISHPSPQIYKSPTTFHHPLSPLCGLWSSVVTCREEARSRAIVKGQSAPAGCSFAIALATLAVYQVSPRCDCSTSQACACCDKTAQMSEEI